ncbi:MAG: hypothetical protein ACLGHN_12635 [Bacteriovoracia bacterium]
MKILILSSLIFLSSCGGGTTTGNPVQRTVSIRMEDQQPLAWIKNLSDSIIPSAYAAVSNISFCFKRLRFKPDSSTDGSNYDLVLGQVTINPAGTNLLSVSVPEGTYTRIEFDLENGCDGDMAKPSVVFTNNSGVRSTNDHTTIKFDGVYVVSADGTLDLDIDALIDAMDTITLDNQIKTTLENAPGSF